MKQIFGDSSTLRRAVALLLSAVVCVLSPLAFLSCGEDAGSGADGSVSSGDGSVTSGEDMDRNPDSSSLSSDLSSGQVKAESYFYTPGSGEDVLAHLPSYDFEGSAFVIATDPAAPMLPSSSVLSPSLEAVNEEIRLAYNTVVYYQQESDAAALLSACETAVANGEYYADLVALPLSQLSVYLEKGLLRPLNTLPYYEELASYDFGCTSVDALMQDGLLYASAGSGALTQLGTVCLLVHRERCAELGGDLDALYESVENGSFTVEHFLSLLEADATSEQTAFRFGSTLSDTSLALVLENMTADLGSGGAETAARLAKQCSGERFLQGSSAAGAFFKGELCFLLTTLSDLSSYSNSNGSWGCLPLPKASLSDRVYPSLLDPDRSYVYAALTGSRRTDGTGLYLTAVHGCADKVCLGYFLPTLLSSVIREDRSLKMIGYLQAGCYLPRIRFPEKTSASASSGAVSE